MGIKNKLIERFSFTEVEEEILSYNSKKEKEFTENEKRRWNTLTEFRWSICFAINYLNKERGLHYEEVAKDNDLENKAIDVTLYSSLFNEEDILIQVVDANEFNQSPKIRNKSNDFSGGKIIYAVSQKCIKYYKNNVDTKNIVLLIYGVDTSSRIEELHQDHFFLREFQILPYFKNIFYVNPSPKVYQLK